MLVTFKIVLSCLDDFDNSSKLAVVDLVSSLYKNHFSQKKG